MYFERNDDFCAFGFYKNNNFIKNRILILLVILSLGGLAFVQYRFLITGLALEKSNLDKKAVALLREIKADLYTPSLLSSEIALFTKPDYIGASPERDTLEARIVRGLRHKITELSVGRDMADVDFAFALIVPGAPQPTVGSPDFDTEQSRFSRYTEVLAGAVTEGCRCNLVLRINVRNIFVYLLGELRNLLIPSALFLLILAACIAWIIRSEHRQRKLAEVKNDFINNLTHELKTPVFSVGLASKMLEEHLHGLPSDKPREYLRLIRAENEKMKGHIDKVLELASLESGRYIMDKRKMPAAGFLRQIAADFQEKLNPETAELETEIALADTVISADENHLRNALENLLENALKYGHPTFTCIRLTAHIKDQRLIISISDNGKGIAPADQKRIFEKFFRVSDGDVHTVKGFGLGLSYVQQVIERHGGKISVQSTLGSGTTFTIKLRL